MLHGLVGGERYAAEAVKQDQAHTDRRGVAKLAFGRDREPQIDEQQAQGERQHQQFMVEQQEVHRVTSVTTALSVTLCWILSVSRRGKHPKTRRLASKRMNGALRQRCGASATAAH